MSKHILLVDDQDDIREVAALTLGSIAGWPISTASNGEDGFDQLQHSHTRRSVCRYSFGPTSFSA